MTLDEMIAVLQAAKRGEVIEVRPRTGGVWTEVQIADWEFSTRDYRVKPRERRRLYQIVNANGHTCSLLYRDREEAEHDTKPGEHVIEYREVMP